MIQSGAHSDEDPPTGQLAPSSPAIDRPSFVLWLGHGQGAMLDDLDRTVVGTVAASIAQAAHNSSALIRARRELDLGLWFDLESRRLQLDLNHPLRAGAWQALGMDGGRKYRPDAQLISSSSARLLATRAIDAQSPSADPAIVNPGVDPTIFTTPAHWLPDGQAGDGRRNDIALAEACLEIFRERQLAAPAVEDPHRRRQLYAALMVDAGRLARGDIAWIIDAYAALSGVHGYVVWAVRFNNGLVQAQRLQELMSALQDRSGRPVIGGGLWHFHTAALTRGLAATCAGPGRLSYPMLPPADLPAKGKQKRGGIFVYHGAILGCFGLGESGDVRRRRAFLRHGCPCGAHPPNQPPATYAEKVAHNRYWLIREARDAITEPGAEARLAARVPGARQARVGLGMGRLASCWSDVSAPGRSAETG